MQGLELWVSGFGRILVSGRGTDLGLVRLSRRIESLRAEPQNEIMKTPRSARSIEKTPDATGRSKAFSRIGAVGLLVTLIAAVAGGSDEPVSIDRDEVRGSEPRSVVVRFVDGADPVAIGRRLAGVGRLEASRVTRGIGVVHLDGNRTVGEALASARSIPGIRLASPNYPTQAAGNLPNDPLFPYQWNEWALRYELARPYVLPMLQTVIAVVDTGVAYADFREGRSGREYGLAPDFDRVRFVPGYDFIDDDPWPIDENQHGTHIAGVIAATIDNGFATAGLVDAVGIQPIRVLGANGTGTLAQLIEGLEFAERSGVEVVNLSLTVSGSANLEVLSDSIDRLVASGAVVIAAAGNTAGEVAFPAAYPPVVAVGAVRFDHCSSTVASSVKLAIYSNWGPQLDLVAPGGDNAMDMDHDGYPDGILATTFDPSNPKHFGAWFGAGTSFAAAHVSAAAAVMRFWGVPGPIVPSLLAETAIDLGRPGFDVQSGYGMLAPGQAFARSAQGNWSEPRVFDVSVVTRPAGNHTVADLRVTDRSNGRPAAGVTVYALWGAPDGSHASAVSDRDGALRLNSATGSGPTVSIKVEAAVVGGAGFIGSITPGVRIPRSLTSVSFESITPTGREPGCGGRNLPAEEGR